MAKVDIIGIVKDPTSESSLFFHAGGPFSVSHVALITKASAKSSLLLSDTSAWLESLQSNGVQYLSDEAPHGHLYTKLHITCKS